jgi:hypothetical protein
VHTVQVAVSTARPVSNKAGTRTWTLLTATRCHEKQKLTQKVSVLLGDPTDIKAILGWWGSYRTQDIS